MSTAIFVLVMINLAYIGLLPVIFFRRDGTLNYKWWLTAAPFFLSAVFVALHYVGLMQPWYGTKFGAVMEATATVFSSTSIALISYTLIRSARIGADSHSGISKTTRRSTSSPTARTSTYVARFTRHLSPPCSRQRRSAGLPGPSWSAQAGS